LTFSEKNYWLSVDTPVISALGTFATVLVCLCLFENNSQYVTDTWTNGRKNEQD